MVELKANKESGEKRSEDVGGKLHSETAAKIAREAYAGKLDFAPGNNSADKHLPQLNLVDEKHVGGMKNQPHSDSDSAGKGDLTPASYMKNEPHVGGKSPEGIQKRVDNRGKVIEPGDLNQNPDRLDENKDINASDEYKNAAKSDAAKQNIGKFGDQMDPTKNFGAGMGKFADQMDPNKNFGAGMGKFADQMDPNKNFGAGMGKFADQMDPNKNFGAGMGKFADQMDPNKNFGAGMGKFADQLNPIKDTGSGVGKAGEQLGQDNKFDPGVMRRVMEENNPFQPIKEFDKTPSTPLPADNTDWGAVRKALDPKYMNNTGF